MKTESFFIYLIIMAGVTYLIRMIPLVLCRGKLENRFLRSFLAYVPYAVLGAMTFPAVFSATGNMISSLGGTMVALFLSYRKKSLLQVAIGACIAAFLIEMGVLWLQ